MDEQKENQDMVVGSDGSMGNGSEKVEVKINSNPEEATNPEQQTTGETVDSVPTPPAMPETEPEEVSVDTASSDVGVEVKQPPTEESSEISEDTTEGSESENSESKLGLSSLNEDGAENDGTDPTLAPGVGSTVASASTMPHGSAEQTQAAKPNEHRNNKKLAVIMTVVVALILAGGAVYVFMSAESNTEEASSNNNSEIDEDVQEDTTPATAEDVDQTSQEVDEAIQSLDDTSDFSEESLSDQNLGIE